MPKGKIMVGFADGSYREFSKNIDPKLLRAMITRDGGEEVEFPEE